MAEMMRQVHALMDEYRLKCLWYMRKDYYPETPIAAQRVLEAIERHGDMAAFKKAATIRQWLSRNSNVPSAG